MSFLRTSDTKGFTLIELLLYIAIVPFILAAAVGLFFLVTQTRIKSQTIGEVEQQGAYIAKTISDAVESAETITAPVANGTSLTLSINGVSTSFAENTGTIVKTIGANPGVELTNAQVEVSDLQFVNNSNQDTPGSVHFEFTLSHINNSGRNEYEYSKTFYGGGSLRP